MKNSTQKNIQWLSIAILFFATVYFAFTIIYSANQIWFQKAVVWNQDKLAWQIFIIAGRFIGTTLLYAFCWIFLVRTNKALRNGEIFPKSNIALIRWTALVSVLSILVHSNYDDVISGASCSVLDGDIFVIPLGILLFSGLYKMAYLAAKDSNLAI